jgi:hypothetical protein
VLEVRGQQRLREDEGVGDDEAVVAPPPGDDAVGAGVLCHHVRLRNEGRRHGSHRLVTLSRLPPHSTYNKLEEVVCVRGQNYLGTGGASKYGDGEARKSEGRAS